MRVLNNEIDITKTFNIQKKDIDGALTYIKIQVKDVNGKQWRTQVDWLQKVISKIKRIGCAK